MKLIKKTTDVVNEDKSIGKNRRSDGEGKLELHCGKKKTCEMKRVN